MQLSASSLLTPAVGVWTNGSYHSITKDRKINVQLEHCVLGIHSISSPTVTQISCFKDYPGGRKHLPVLGVRHTGTLVNGFPAQLDSPRTEHVSQSMIEPSRSSQGSQLRLRMRNRDKGKEKGRSQIF